MLSAIAAVFLVIGSISSTVSVTRNGSNVVERTGEPTVEVQVVESSDFLFE